jgi:RNA-splicing ligase RtcB
MDLSLLQRQSDVEWAIVPSARCGCRQSFMPPRRSSAPWISRSIEQVTNVATLPGIIRASYAMPDAHWGHGFPIGGVAAIDPELGGVVSAGGVGFAISCGVRTLNAGLSREAIQPVQARLADALFRTIPAGLGHQIGTECLKEIAVAAARYGIDLPDRELACAPIQSPLGQTYLGTMRAAINCELANRQIATHLVRQAFAEVFPHVHLPLLYDVSHNTCKLEEHVIDGQPRRLFVHHKGATRAFGPGHPEIPGALRPVSQPVLIGGTMSTSSYILVGTSEGMGLAFGFACHGAGRSMSRHQALKQWRGQEVIDHLASRGTLIRSPAPRGVAEEAPGAYKDVSVVVEAAHTANLARKVARLEPLICIKG